MNAIFLLLIYNVYIDAVMSQPQTIEMIRGVEVETVNTQPLAMQ